MSPQADYVVSNGTGAAVRSDINGQLAAIVSNNSGASAPATTYAYMLWADTSTNLLKLRNGANSAWITVGDLTAANLGLATLASPTFTGTATIPTLTVSTAANIPLGSAASPTLYFTGDSNTGLYSPGADQVALSTGGTGRLFIDSSGRCGIGTSSPSRQFSLSDTNPTATFRSTSTTGQCTLFFGDSDSDARGAITYENNGDKLGLWSAGGQKLTIDSSGNVGIGVTDPGSWNANYNGPMAVIGSTANTACGLVLLSSATGNSRLDFSQGTGPFGQSRGSVVYNHTTDSLAFSTNNGERARIDSSGRLLVGTSSTSSNARAVFQAYQGDTSGPGIIRLAAGTSLPVNGSDLGSIEFSDSGHTNAARIQVSRDGGTWTSGTSQPTRLSFSTTADGASSPTERMRIQNDGKILINATATASYFDGTLNIAGRINQKADSEMFIWNTQTSGTRYLIGFGTGSTYANVGTISTNGSSTAYNTTSDYRLKENVTAVADGIARLQQLKPSRFNFIVEPGKTVDGFIAHEVQAVVPEAITGTKDEVDADGNPVYQGIDQSKLVPLLTAALQEAIAKIESLEARLTAAGI